MTDFFSPDYFTARARFRSGVLSNGGQIESILLDAKGPGGEDLRIDIGWFGSAEPQRAFVHSSGLGGVEGFAGSAIQLQWLESGFPRDLPANAATAVVHSMNPFGMAWLRRTNENNVDLNRNFLSADDEYSGAPEHYEALDALLNPPSPPTRDLFLLRALLRASALKRCFGEGQYEYPRGLFFGGKQHEQEARRFQLYISGKLAQAEHIVAIDVHTGPGRFGEDRLIASAPGKGSLDGLYHRMFPGARIHFAVQEFGVCSRMKALRAMREENRRHHYGGEARSLRDVFCPANAKWRERVLTRGKEAITQGLALAFESAAADGVPPD